MDFLRDKPVRMIWGIGAAGQASLEAVGIRTFADLRRWDRRDLHERFGTMGERLWHLSRGEDSRRVSADRAIKIHLQRKPPLPRTSRPGPPRRPYLAPRRKGRRPRPRPGGLAGRTVTLKLKRQRFPGS